MPVEPFNVNCDSAYVYQQNAPRLGGRRIRVREARTDLDGYVAELLSKAVSQAELDQRLTRNDRENLIEYLRRAGALDERDQYRGSPRRGDDAAGSPLALSDLLGSKVGLYSRRTSITSPRCCRLSAAAIACPPLSPRA